MSAGDGRRRRRSLSADERALWKRYARTVRPLRPQPVEHEPEAEPAAQTAAEVLPIAAPAAPRVKAAAAPPPLAPLERKLKQRIGRGVRAIDARIDLHGLTQAQAHHALLRFLHQAQADACQVVLVITGKGAPGDQSRERGVLRRQVPLWVTLPEFRGYVIGFDPAHGTHGGDGALYVRIRRRRNG